MSTITAKIQLRRDTSANWTSNNPILLAGEMALSTDVFYTGTDQPRYKIGNGVDTWLNLDYVPEGGGSTSYPENLYLTVVNKTTNNLLASGYKVLKVQTAQGQRLAVDYALADSDANSADTIGVVYENINNNQTGRIVVIGEITGLNTTGSLQGESWNDGDLLFLSPSTPGGMTTTRPTAPDHGVILGYVVYSHVNNGKIYIKIDNGYEIGELHNCYLPSPTNNQGIFWSSGTTRYENKSIATVLGYTPSQGYSLSIPGGHITYLSPPDANTFYFGNGRNSSIYSPDASIVIPNAGTIKKIGILSIVNGTLGSAENSTFSVRKRTGTAGTSTDTVITNTYKFNTIYNTSMYTGFNISVAEGDLIEIKWDTPTWVTNPTTLQINITLFIA
jgi:hypothetical protein